MSVQPQDLIDQATASTGLSDLGEDSFREGLEILLRSLGTEARLNAAGEATIYPRLVGHLSQRLQIEDWYRRHPEIEDEEIRDPLFGIGLPRTGSTVLSFLLSQDSGVRYLHHWESFEPCPPPGVENEHGARSGRAATDQSGIGTRRHVPSDLEGPMECLDLMALDFKTQMYEAFARIPTYSDWLFDADLTSTYLYERRVLKLLQWRMPTLPWRLKAPTHADHLPELLTAFPDARFVMTHRDPTDVLVSVCDVFADIQGRLTDHLDRHAIGAVNLAHRSGAMQRVVDFRDAGGDDLFYDIDFRAMLRDPIAEVRGLYAWLGEPVTPEFEAAMRTWWQMNSEREPNPKTDAATYGLDLDQVRPIFADYVKHAEEWTSHGS